MEITGKSQTNYNFNGIEIGSENTETEFFNKEALIVISNFDSKFPIGCINYTLTHFELLTKDNLEALIEEVKFLYNRDIWSKAPNKEPNYIGYITDGNLKQIQSDIVKGEEYKRTFKIQF